MKRSLKSTWNEMNHAVFWAPFLLLFAAVALSLLDGPQFIKAGNVANAWVLDNFSGWFAFGSLGLVVCCAVVFVSPLGKIRLGGPKARPTLTLWQWFTITLCTTLAAGILFWASAEPIYHIMTPPKSLGLTPGSTESATFAMSTLFMHWTITPYAIYTLPALMFGFAFYNMRQPLSLASCLAPLLGGKPSPKVGAFIDSICLYALVAGMAASLGTGVLTIAGGLEHIYGIRSAPPVWIGIGTVIVLAFLISAFSGVTNGVRILSDINTKIYFLFIALILAFGPIAYLVHLGGGALQQYASTFWERSVFSTFAANDSWPKSWTVFYWAVWLAWAPVTALFLGRIAYGYTVRMFVLMNLVIPAAFSGLWMLLIGGTTIHMEVIEGLKVSQLLTDKGPEALSYFVLAQFPASKFVIPLFLGTIFLSYVTAADSNTITMAAMSSKGMSAENCNPKPALKVVWGGLVGVLALVMICTTGVDGIKTISNLGGLPALLFEMGAAVALLVVAFRPARFCVHEQELLANAKLTFDGRDQEEVPEPAVALT